MIRAGALPGTRVLDAGCGTGRFSAALTDRHAAVVGVDSDPDMLAVARGRLAGGCARAVVEQLPFPDEAFDLTVGVTVLEFVADPAAALAQLARVTGAGGRIVIGALNPGDVEGARRLRPPRRRILRARRHPLRPRRRRQPPQRVVLHPRRSLHSARRRRRAPLDPGDRARRRLRATATLGLPVLAWVIPGKVARLLNEEFATTFVGRGDDDLDIAVAVDRTRQLDAIRCHRSQSADNPVLWRRLDLLGPTEHLRYLTSV